MTDAYIHLALHNKTRCGLPRFVEGGTATVRGLQLADYRGTPDQPLLYEPMPTCPKCLAADPELQAYLKGRA